MNSRFLACAALAALSLTFSGCAKKVAAKAPPRRLRHPLRAPPLQTPHRREIIPNRRERLPLRPRHVCPTPPHVPAFRTC